MLKILHNLCIVFIRKKIYVKEMVDTFFKILNLSAKTSTAVCLNTKH